MSRTCSIRRRPLDFPDPETPTIDTRRTNRDPTRAPGTPRSPYALMPLGGSLALAEVRRPGNTKTSRSPGRPAVRPDPGGAGGAVANPVTCPAARALPEAASAPLA